MTDHVGFKVPISADVFLFLWKHVRIFILSLRIDNIRKILLFRVTPSDGERKTTVFEETGSVVLVIFQISDEADKPVSKTVYLLLLWRTDSRDSPRRTNCCHLLCSISFSIRKKKRGKKKWLRGKFFRLTFLHFSLFC